MNCLAIRLRKRAVGLSRLIAGLSGCVPAAAAAHPHGFVDASLTLRLDDRGRLGGRGQLGL
ncbi:DUF1007 family protein [Paracoccus versutus]|nr:DUF1007 family protein [Paracoccus versutus]